MRVAHAFAADRKYVFSLAFDSSDSYLLSGAMGGNLKVWDAATWNPVRDVEGHSKSVNVMAFNGAQSLLATGSSDCDVRLWSFPEFEAGPVLRDRKKVVSAMAVSEDGERFAIGSYGGRVAAWDFQGAELGSAKVLSRNVSAVAFSPDGGSLLAAGLGGEIHRLEFPACESREKIAAHEMAVTFAGFAHDGDLVLSLGYAADLKLWDAADWSLVRSAQLHDDRISGVRYDKDRHRLLVLSAGLIRIFSLETWTYVDELSVDCNIMHNGVFASDGASAAVASADGRILIVEVN